MASYATDLPGFGEGHSLLQRDAIVASSPATYGQAWAEENNLTASSIHPLSSGSDSGSREEKGCSAAARDAFELFDSDRDGLLNVSEFRKCMAQLGTDVLPDDEEAKLYMKYTGIDENGCASCPTAQRLTSAHACAPPTCRNLTSTETGW